MNEIKGGFYYVVNLLLFCKVNEFKAIELVCGLIKDEIRKELVIIDCAIS